MLFKRFIGLSLVTLLVSTSAGAVSPTDQCASGEAVLQLKRGIQSATRIASLKDAARRVVTSDARSLISKKRGGKRAVIQCEREADPCRALLRNARRLGEAEFLRVKGYACSRNFQVGISASTTNDPYANRTWGLYSKRAIDINAPGAWRRTKGSRAVYVAVIDTGIDCTHPDLAANCSPYQYNAIDDSPGANDGNGHGTHVAGTIGALGNNNEGVAGVNWYVSLVGLKFLDSSGSGFLSDAVKAINKMVEWKLSGVDIIASNNSWGGGSYSAALHAAIVSANNAGILFVAAAGNEANDNDEFPSYPASYEVPNVISVAAVDRDGVLAYFSNYGRNSVDIAAPGVDILSTYPGNQYAYLSGTSMAAPHVTGVAALIKSVAPTLSPDQITSAILASAVRRSSIEKNEVAKRRFLSARRSVNKAIEMSR